MTPVERVLAALSDARQTGPGQWTAKCPAHDDTKPSLSVSVGDGGRVLVHCYAGCTPEAITAALGLTLADLMPDGGGPAPSLTRYEIRNPAGVLVAVHERYDRPGGGKTFAWFRPDRQKGLGGLRVADLPLYGAERLGVLQPGAPVIVDEGEKATDALRNRGIAAVGTVCGAAVVPAVDVLRVLLPFRVLLWPDNDEAGRKHMQGIGQRLRELGTKDIRIVNWPDAPLHGDAADFHGDVRELVAAAKVFQPGDAVAEDRPDAVLVRVADVKAEPLRWLWPSRFPLGKVSLLVGDPDLGKSLISLDMAARVSTGRAWPDGAENGETGDVILLSAEDDVGDTIRPRLEAAGADLERVHVLEGIRRRDPETGQVRSSLFSLAYDLATVEGKLAAMPGVRLIVLDPLSAYLGMRIDTHRDAAVRGLLAPLSGLAAKRKVAVVCISHLNKNRDSGVVYRVTGSLAITAAARAVWVVARDPQNPNRKLMLCVKNNLAANSSGLAYTIIGADGGDVAAIAWEPGAVTADVAEVLGGLDLAERRDRAEAGEWLRDLLADGPLAAKRVLAEGLAGGFSQKTLRRAAKDVGVRHTRDGATGWVWSVRAGTEDGQSEDGQPRAPGWPPSKMANAEIGHVPPGASKTGVDPPKNGLPEGGQVEDGQGGHLGLATFGGDEANS